MVRCTTSHAVFSVERHGDDVVVKFIKNVLQCEQLLINTTKFNKYMIFTKENRDEFEKASVCFICNNNKGIKGKQEK